jgi:hypothetical protein
LSLKVQKTWVCDICDAEWGDFSQKLAVTHVEALAPTFSRNSITYHGVTADLCMMCMAPVHHALMQQMEKIQVEKGGKPP